MALINIMSKTWCEKNKATKPQNYTQKEDMITARQANGTGAYMLKEFEVGKQSVKAVTRPDGSARPPPSRRSPRATSLRPGRRARRARAGRST